MVTTTRQKRQEDKTNFHGTERRLEVGDIRVPPESPFDVEMQIEMKLDAFESTSNPVFALEVFMLAVQEGIYPPVETLRWLASGIRKWHDGCGKESLDSALGMVVGKGKVPFFKQLLMEDRNEMVLLDMCQLTTLGATIEEASAMVEKKLSDADWNKTPYDMADLNAETIALKYSKSRLRELFSIEKPPLNNPAWVSEWLSTFDVAYMPKALKSRL